MWQPQGFYNDYVLRTPVILSGEESVKGLFNYPAAKVAAICGNSFKDKGIFDETFSKQDVRIFNRSWKCEPDIESLFGTVHELEEFSPDVIVAVGGGSVIDGAKLCRLLYEFPYYVVEETRLTGKHFRTKFIAVPTTIGSGAEVSSAAVFIDKATHKKDMVVMHELQPDVVVYDTRYVKETPKRLLTASAMDAMAHILEGYVSNVSNCMIEIMAESAFIILFNEIKKFYSKEDAEVDYSRLQYAGYLGGIVQNHCIVGAAHAVAHQLSDFGYSHGEAVALLLPGVIKVNSQDEAVKRKYVDMLSKVGFSDIESFTGFLEKLDTQTGLSERKKELSELLLRLLSDASFVANVKNDKGGKGNPVEITDAYLKKLIGSI